MTFIVGKRGPGGLEQSQPLSPPRDGATLSVGADGLSPPSCVRMRVHVCVQKGLLHHWPPPARDARGRSLLTVSSQGSAPPQSFATSLPCFLGPAPLLCQATWTQSQAPHTLSPRELLDQWPPRDTRCPHSDAGPRE